MKIIYFTTLAPCGRGESFVLNEIRAMKSLGTDITVMPVRSEYRYKGDELSVVRLRPHASLKDFFSAVLMLLSRPVKCLGACGNMLFKANGAKNGFKNLFFFNKALCCARYIIKNGGADFIHAHWLATTSSVAYIVSYITDIPFCITGHRFDVYADNAIRQKGKRAAFIRLIDKNGLNAVKAALDDEDRKKAVLIHLGADIPESIPSPKTRFDTAAGQNCFSFAVPASLIPVKGHRYLIEAAALLKKRRINGFRFLCFGDGGLKTELLSLATNLGVDRLVEFCGSVDNRKLLEMYKNNEIFAVMLPSVDLGHNLHEGIPVSLMEAMANSLPAVSTNTGGIYELLGKTHGLLLPEKSPEALADAAERLITDRDFYVKSAAECFNIAKNEFNNLKNTELLLETIIKSTNGGF